MVASTQNVALNVSMYNLILVDRCSGVWILPPQDVERLQAEMMCHCSCTYDVYLLYFQGSQVAPKNKYHFALHSVMYLSPSCSVPGRHWL